MATTRLHTRRLLSVPVLAFGGVLLLAVFGAAAQNASFFRIGTGSTGGTYFPIGGLIANAVSNPPGSRPCDKGGSCGVPGLIAVAVSTKGSVTNVAAIAAGELESGLSQADVAYWAFTGTGTYRKKKQFDNLRIIANLYPESVHLVVRADSGIKTVAGLKGKRVSLGEKGSGTLVDARIILKAYGLGGKRVKVRYQTLEAASNRLAEGKLDGFFFVAGAPASAIESLAQRADIRLVPIAGKQAEKLAKQHRFFGHGAIPAGVYKDVPATETLTVGAQWVVSAAVDEDLVYALTQALWHDNTRRLLDRGHPKGKQVRIETALTGVAIPIHPGAARFYNESGMIEDMPTADTDRPAN